MVVTFSLLGRSSSGTMFETREFFFAYGTSKKKKQKMDLILLYSGETVDDLTEKTFCFSFSVVICSLEMLRVSPKVSTRKTSCIWCVFFLFTGLTNPSPIFICGVAQIQGEESVVLLVGERTIFKSPM